MQLEAPALVEGDGTGLVADPDADVVHFLELKHFVGTVAWRASLRDGQVRRQVAKRFRAAEFRSGPHTSVQGKTVRLHLTVRTNGVNLLS